MDIFHFLIGFLAKILGIQADVISEETLLIEDLNIDSIKIAEMIFLFKKKYDVEIPDDAYLDWTKVGDIMIYLKANHMDALSLIAEKEG